jgi:tetratricopeptide (TPR) repeat protein
MVSVHQKNNEPSPEFNDHCMGLLKRWEDGDLPFKEAVAQLTMLSQRANAEGHLVNQGRAEQLLAYVQHYRGNLDASIYHNERARTLYAKAENLRRVGIIDLNQGENYRFKGDFARAVRLYQSAQHIAEQLEDQQSLTLAAVNEGLVLVTLGRNKDARKSLQRGLELAKSAPNETEVQQRTLNRLYCEIHHGMAVIHLRENEPEAAWEQAQKALALAEQTGDPILRGYAHRTIGEVLTALGEAFTDGDDPDTYFRAAMESFRSLNAEAEMARTMYAQAISLAKRGRRTTAARKLQHVMIMFSRLGMVDDAARAAEAQLNVT